MMQPNGEIELIVQYRNNENAARKNEFDYCMIRNLNNPWIRAVHCLTDDDALVPEVISSHSKYREKHIGHWLKYSDAIEYANESLVSKSSIACLANLDIFLDDTGTDWSQMRTALEARVVFCLSRHDFDPEGPTITTDPGFKRLAFGQTQDAWLFRPPTIIKDCDFEIGMLGCDNAFAARVLQSNYIPVNAMYRYKIFHFDIARGKSSSNQSVVHTGEEKKQQRPPNRHPERVCQYLVPDIDSIKSIDKLLDDLKIPELARYQIACGLLSQFVKIRND